MSDSLKGNKFFHVNDKLSGTYIYQAFHFVLQHFIIEKLIMSTEEEEEEENRLYQCLRKYQKIVKQFDELVEMMDVRTRPPKRRRGARGSSSPIDPASANQTENEETFVQTITRFLHELKSNPSTDPDCSTSTRDRE